MPHNNPAQFYFSGTMYDCPPNVYFPAEDSYLLAENVKIKKGEVVADVGCGSGIQSLNALMNGASKVYALDVNKHALAAAKKNCAKAGFGKKIVAVESDLFSDFEHKVDIIIFNPPYVASNRIKIQDLDGGKNGREVLDRFLDEMPAHLNDNGKCFFLQTDLNGHAKTEKKLAKAGMDFKIVAKKRGFFEELAVYECSKRKGKPKQ